MNTNPEEDARSEGDRAPYRKDRGARASAGHGVSASAQCRATAQARLQSRYRGVQDNGTEQLAAMERWMERWCGAGEDRCSVSRGNPHGGGERDMRVNTSSVDASTRALLTSCEPGHTAGGQHREWAWVDCLDRGGDPREGLSIEGIIRGLDVGDISGGKLSAAPDDVTGGERNAVDDESLDFGQKGFQPEGFQSTTPKWMYDA